MMFNFEESLIKDANHHYSMAEIESGLGAHGSALHRAQKAHHAACMVRDVENTARADRLEDRLIGQIAEEFLMGIPFDFTYSSDHIEQRAHKCVDFAHYISLVKKEHEPIFKEGYYLRALSKLNQVLTSRSPTHKRLSNEEMLVYTIPRLLTYGEGDNIRKLNSERINDLLWEMIREYEHPAHFGVGRTSSIVKTPKAYDWYLTKLLRMSRQMNHDQNPLRSRKKIGDQTYILYDGTSHNENLDVEPVVAGRALCNWIDDFETNNSGDGINFYLPSSADSFTLVENIGDKLRLLLLVPANYIPTADVLKSKLNDLLLFPLREPISTLPGLNIPPPMKPKTEQLDIAD